MRSDLNDLAAFSLVAEERSFTRAARRLGLTQSALSHAMRGLEQRLGLELLARTTRSVAPTAAGTALLRELNPALEQIEGAIGKARLERGRPAGRVRLMVARSAAPLILLPKLAAFAREFPEVEIDVEIVSGPTDLVAGRFDAGIVAGEYIARDMVAVRVSQDQRLAVFASPSYFKIHPIPRAPRNLAEHPCLGYYGTSGRYRWEFSKGRRNVTVAVKGPLAIDDAYTVIQGALAGVGIGLALEAQVREHVSAGRLVRVLEDWCPSFPGFFLYYPSRRNQPAALAALIRTLRLV